MAKDLACEIGYIYIDTGAMYRSVTLYALRNNLFDEDGTIKLSELEKQMPDINISFKLNEATGRPDTYLNNENVEKEIRTMEVSSHVSPIAAVPFVRAALVSQQQRMGDEKGIVMDGRDIGTVVFPQAELKIFVTASAEVRAQRRYDELKAKGMEANFTDILRSATILTRIERHHPCARPMMPLSSTTATFPLPNKSNGYYNNTRRFARHDLYHKVNFLKAGFSMPTVFHRHHWGNCNLSISFKSQR